MFTKIIQSVLMKHVGKYLNEVEENSFDVGLIDGDILIENVGLNNKLFEELNLPITLKFSNIDRLSIKVPWTRLDKQPSVVQLSGLNVLITMEQHSTNNESTGLSYKFNRVISWIREQLKRDREGQKKDKDINLEDDSFATKMLLRIIDNITVEISNVHVRFEDNSSFQKQSLSLGLLIDRIIIETTDPDGNSQFYHRSFSGKKRNERLIKSVTISPVRIYWNHEETWFIKDAVDCGASKNEVIWLMRAPFPDMRDQPISSNSNAKKKPTGTETSSNQLDLQGKKEKKQKPNAFLELFKPRESKKKEDKKKEAIPSKAEQQLPAKHPEPPVKVMKKLQPFSEWNMLFETVARIGVSATVEMNDLKGKDTPLLEIEVIITSLEVRSNQVVLGQLFCLLQHFLKYATDIYFYENRSSINNSNLEASNKERFHAAVTAILKKNSKTKKFEELTPDHFGGSVELRDQFFRVLEGYSIKRLEEFAEAFIFEWRMKKEIDKAREGHSRSKDKSMKDMQKIMDKIRSNEKQEKDDELVINTTRAIFELKLQLDEAKATIDYFQEKQKVDSLSLQLKRLLCQLRFVAEDELDLMLKLQDVVLSYTNSNGRTIFLNKNVVNKEEKLVSIIYSQKKRQYVLTGELQRKALVVSDEIVGFVLHFFERLRINVFMLNLLVEKVELSIDKLNLLIKMLLDSLKEIKCDLTIYLPVLELHIAPFHLLVEPGVVCLNITNYELIELTLSSVFVKMRHLDNQYKLVDDAGAKATLKRHQLEGSKYEDIIDLTIDKLTLMSPPIQVVDLLALEMLGFGGKVGISTSNLVVKRRELLVEKVHYNNYLEEFDMYLNGELLEFVSPTGHNYSTSVFCTRAYPLVHNHRHYLVLVKKGNIEYVELPNFESLSAERMNSMIEKLSTRDQLTIFWSELNKYEQALEANALRHNHLNLLNFIENTQRQARSRTFKLYEVRLNLTAMQFDMSQLSIQLKRLQLKSVHHEHNQHLELQVGRFTIAVETVNVIELAPSQHNNDFLQFNYEKVVSEQCQARLGTIDINLSAGLLSPVLNFVADIMGMRFIKAQRQQRKLVPPAQFSSHRLFSLRQVEFKGKIDRITFEFFTAVSTVEDILVEASRETSHANLQLSIRGIDVLDFVRIPSCVLSLKINQVQGSSLTIGVESLTIEISPAIFEKYLSIMRLTADGVLMNLQVLHKIQVEILHSIEFDNMVKRGVQREVVIKLQNLQLQVVLNEQNALALCFDEAQLEIRHKGQPHRQLVLSIMRLHLERIHESTIDEQLQSTIIRPFSITARGELSSEELRRAQLAITKIDVEINFELMEFLLLVLQRYIVIYGKNPWFGGFLRKFIEQEQFVLKASVPVSMLDFNTQLDEVTLVYLRDGGGPFIKLVLKSTNRNLEISSQHFDATLGFELELSHFNWRFKMFQPLLERSEIQVVARRYLGKGVNSIETALKTVRMNISKDLTLDLIRLHQRVQQYLQLHRSRFLEVAFYWEQVTTSSSKQLSPAEESSSPETKKKRNLIENIKLNHLVIADSLPRRKHIKNYIKICNRLGVDVVCWIDYLSNEEPREPMNIATGQDHLLPMAMECEYTENYQILERLMKLKMELRVAEQLVYSKVFNHSTFLSETVEIVASEQLKFPISLNVNSQVLDDEYTIQFTTAKKVENKTKLDFELVFRSEHCPDYRAILPSCSAVFMPFFTTNCFCISVAGSRQVFLLNFSKSEQPQEIKLPGPNDELHCLIMYSQVKEELFIMTLEVGLEVWNHLPVYAHLQINGGSVLLEPNKAARTTQMSLHEGAQKIKFDIPMQTNPGAVDVDTPQKLCKEREILCPLIDGTAELTFFLLLVGQPTNRLLHIYPRLTFINETPQKLFVFSSAYGALFPVQKLLRDNSEDYEKISFHDTQESAVKCRIKPLRSCYVLDSECYLHLGLRNCKKGLSEEFVTYESDFRKTVSAEEDNLVYKYCVRYQETPLTGQISTFRARLLPKFYLINRTEYIVHLFEDTRVAPNEMVVLPFNKDGLLTLDLESKQGRFYQLAPAELFDKGQIRYDTKNIGFMSISQIKQGQISYDDRLIVKLELELIFNNFLGYYILNRNTERLVVRNRMKQHTLQFRDGNSETFKIQYSIKSGEEKHLFPVFSQSLHLKINNINQPANEPQKSEPPFEEQKLEETEQKKVEEPVPVRENKPEDGNEPLINREVNLSELASIEHELFFVLEHFENNLRVVTFVDSDEVSEDEQPNQQNIHSISKLTLDSFELSFVFENFNLQRRQVMNLRLEKLSLTALNYQYINIMEAKLQEFMVRSNETQAYPILLRKQQRENVSERPFVELFMQANPTTHTIENFRMEFSPLSVSISDEIIELLMRNVQGLNSKFLISPSELTTNSRGEPADSFGEFYKLYNKKKQKLLEKGNHHQVKLVNFSIASIEVELTLKQVHFQGNKKYLKSFGFSFVDIDRARLCLSELKIMDAQQPQEQFVGAIIGSYYNESLSLAFSALGGMNIIGNPKEFFMEIKTGVGRYNSGIVRGTGGLLRGVTAGAVNAVSKIMGSLGNGIGSLSLDDKYLTEREVIKQRQINGFMDGLSSSGLSIYKGLECGITGLVRQPYQGMKQDGFFGALKGSLKGLAGLITKPLTGLIDATSKTAEGLTVVSSLNKQSRSLEEWYKPLFFLRNIIRPYDEIDQMSCLFLRKFLPEELSKHELVKCFLLESEDPSTFVEILVVSLRQLLQIEIKSKKVQLRIDTKWLRATAKFSEGVVLYYEDDGEEEQIILRLKRNNDLKNLLYFTLQKLIETAKQIE